MKIDPNFKEKPLLTSVIPDVLSREDKLRNQIKDDPINQVPLHKNIYLHILMYKNITIFILLLFLLFIFKKNEYFVNIQSPLKLNINNLINKSINSNSRIDVKDKIYIGNRVITKEDIIALKSLPLAFDNKMCIGNECVYSKEFNNLKKYWILNNSCFFRRNI